MPARLSGWKKPKVAVFVGSSKGTDESLVMKDGPRVHTLWGYLAWRLAGDAGLALVAESEAARTNPGSEIMVEVLKLAGPSLILLDELVAYARQLPDDRFEAFLSFIQSLTEAAKMVPGALIIGSLPESDLEAGGAKGASALRRLQTVALPDAKNRVRAFPHELSGGMRQRVMIAMALANDPDILIADEPTTALDVTIQAQILHVLRTLQIERGLTIVLITHDLGVVAGLADTVHVMYAGTVVEAGPVVDVFHRSNHPYTAGLLASLPRLDRPERDLVPIGGMPPSLRDEPAGCAFAPRCRHAVEACWVHAPKLQAVDALSVACDVLPFKAERGR